MYQHSLRSLREAFRSGDLSPVEVVQASLDRIEAVNPRINAIYHLDADGALEAAKRSERRWLAGTPLGILDGIPITIKDALPTIGMPSYRGSAAETVKIADTDHPTVARVREAGAIVLGKNTMCDYGILVSGTSSHHGVTRNPWNLDWNTGASSSGAASSVAAGIEPATIGTDIVGSIRIPASYCGLAGLKPSQGRVPYYFPNHPALVAGPLARNVADLAVMMNVLTLPDGRDFTALEARDVDYLEGLDDFDPFGKRVVVIPDLGLGMPTAGPVRAALEAVRQALEERGAYTAMLRAEPFTPDELAPIEDLYLLRCLAEFVANDEARQGLSPYIQSWTARGRDLSALDLQHAWTRAQLLRERAFRLIDEADFLILPSTADTAFQADRLAPDGVEPFALWAPTCLFNLTEQPAASVPFGLDPAGKPIGVQVVGPRFQDREVLRFARLIEKVAPAIGTPTGLD